MPTFTVQMRTDRCGWHGVVLLELVVVLAIMAMMTALAAISFSGALGRGKFASQADEFVNTMKMAGNAAAESERRYAVAIDFLENTYELRQFTKIDFEQVLEEEPILKSGKFTDQCQLDYVLFDDFYDTRELAPEELDTLRVWFWASKSGWQYGGKIVLLDADGNPYSVVVSRLSRVITLQNGDVDILEPKEKDDLPF